MSKIVLDAVHKEFSHGQVLLDNVNVEFDEQSVNYIVGKSGTGKTTLVRILLGLTRPTTGRVIVDKVDITQLSRKEMTQYRQSIGIVLQDSALTSDRSVAENVAMPLWILGLKKNEIKDRIQRSLKVVGLAGASDILPTRLSTGERQRVSLARAIAHRPKILIADEPTGNLDPDLSVDVLSLFDMIPEFGTTVIIATHEQQLLTHSERIYEISDGKMQLKSFEPIEN